MSEKTDAAPSWLRGRWNDIALAVAIVTTLLGGMHLIIQWTVAPLQSQLHRMDARITTRFDRIDARLDRMDARLDQLSERVARLEANSKAN